jgi:Ni,Fe-hydrogenase III large subunit
MTVGNGEAISIDRVTVYPLCEWREAVIREVKSGFWRLSTLFGAQSPKGGIRLYAVLAGDRVGELDVFAVDLDDVRYQALTPQCPQAHLFEREIYEQTGVMPVGHPWLKPVRFLREQDAFYKLEGSDVHEVAVGPVHAGVIEPGHFRFQCRGETVFNLEIALGYQHRGVEKMLVGGPDARSMHLLETVAGDTTIGHSWAYAQALEGLAGCAPSRRALELRAVALELERLANHTGDLGALAGDVGYLPTNAFCGRLRGDFLNMTALLCGNRFGRGLVRPGGVRFDLEPARVEVLVARLRDAMDDVEDAAELLFSSPSVLSRFETTGVISQAGCLELGLVGPTARACGVRRDLRTDFSVLPYAGKITAVDHEGGDVYSRARVRWLEMQESARFIEQQVNSLSGDECMGSVGALSPRSLVVSLVECWRGEVCHVALTDEAGKLLKYKITDPSFHNWKALEVVMCGGQISDFPLCNKSFNLSYCGHDL